MIADEIKFDKIVEDWFENGIKKSIQSAPNQFIANLDKLKKEYPEAEKLESLEIYLDPIKRVFMNAGLHQISDKLTNLKQHYF